MEVEVNGEVCKFDEDDHEYLLDDNTTIPGVTTITGILDKSQPIKWWAVNEARDYIKETMEPGKEYDEVEINELADSARTAHMNTSSNAISIGNLIHEYCEDYMDYLLHDAEEPRFPDNSEAQESCIEFLDWLEQNDVQPICMEQMVYHPSIGYAGTYDLKAEVNGELLVIDYKTSSGIYEDYLAQVTAYAFGEELRTGEDVDGIAILRFPKEKAGFEEKIITDREELERHFEGFKGCKKVLEWEEEN